MTYRHDLWVVPVLLLGSLTACTAEKTAMLKGGEVPALVELPATSAEKTLDVPGYASTEHLQAIYFDLGSSKLNGTGQEAVKKNAEWLKQNPPFLVKVVGLSDSRGSDKHNKTLAERRAINVREAYASAGIPKERIAILGQGVDSSVCTDLSETCLSQSRRVETLIEHKALASK